PAFLRGAGLDQRAAPGIRQRYGSGAPALLPPALEPGARGRLAGDTAHALRLIRVEKAVDDAVVVGKALAGAGTGHQRLFVAVALEDVRALTRPGPRGQKARLAVGQPDPVEFDRARLDRGLSRAAARAPPAVPRRPRAAGAARPKHDVVLI